MDSTIKDKTSELPSQDSLEFFPSLVKTTEHQGDINDTLPERVNPKVTFGQAMMNPFIFFTVLTSLAGVLALGTLWNKNSGKVSELKAELLTLQSEHDKLKGCLENGDMILLNNASAHAQIWEYKLFYFDEDRGEIIHARGDVNEMIEAGEEFPIRRSESNSRFNGKVLFYSFDYSFSDDEGNVQNAIYNRTGYTGGRSSKSLNIPLLEK